MTKKSDKLSFESALERLNEIAESLEAGQNNLDDSIKLFEEGIKLSEFCRKHLEKAEAKVKTLLKTDSGFEEKPGLE